jgi:hypothetical protein
MPRTTAPSDYFGWRLDSSTGVWLRASENRLLQDDLEFALIRALFTHPCSSGFLFFVPQKTGFARRLRVLLWFTGFRCIPFMLLDL